MNAKDIHVEHASAFDICYVIVGMKFNAVFEEGFYDEDDQKSILELIDVMSEEMYIDSSYVDKKDSKYKSSFMLDDGWTSLCDVVNDSKFCKYLHPKSQETLVDAFCMMGKCYMYECMSLYYDVQHIQLEVDPEHDFEVVFLKDTTHAWKHYPGKWQTWKDDIWSHDT